MKRKLSWSRRRLIRAVIMQFLQQDPEIRAVIARCARAVAKDYIEDWAELGRQEAWTCPVCGKHECDGPGVHGIYEQIESA